MLVQMGLLVTKAEISACCMNLKGLLGCFYIGKLNYDTEIGCVDFSQKLLHCFLVTTWRQKDGRASIWLVQKQKAKDKKIG